MISAKHLPKRVLMAQALLVVATAGGFLAVSGVTDAIAAFYGGAITLSGSWWLSRRVRRAGDLAQDNPGSGMIALYGGAIERFVFVVIAFAVGFGVLKLSVLPLMTGFVLTYLGFLVAAVRGS